MANLYDFDEAISKLDVDVDVPEWIEQDVTPADVAAIVHGGCASGAYMPAVTYHQARATMNAHGDAVLTYLQQHGIDWREYLNEGDSWDGIACTCLSLAVEAWAGAAEGELSEALDDMEDEEPAEDRERREALFARGFSEAES